LLLTAAATAGSLNVVAAGAIPTLAVASLVLFILAALGGHLVFHFGIGQNDAPPKADPGE
jgi:hypothetical protein